MQNQLRKISTYIQSKTFIHRHSRRNMKLEGKKTNA